MIGSLFSSHWVYNGGMCIGYIHAIYTPGARTAPPGGLKKKIFLIKLFSFCFFGVSFYFFICYL